MLTSGRVSSNLTGGNFFLKLKIFRYNTIDKYYLVSCNGVYKSNQDFMSQIPFMVRLKHVAHMATLRLICPVVLLLKYYQIKIFAIPFYAIRAVRYFEFSRVTKQNKNVTCFFKCQEYNRQGQIYLGQVWRR